jgi:NADH-quinone oxidoreductase subunit K
MMLLGFSLVSLRVTLLLAAALFSLGLYAVLSRRNAVSVLMGVELILNAANLQFAGFSRFASGRLDGQVFALFVIVLAAAEAAVALAIILALYTRTRSILVDEADRLRDD